jgi:transposase
MGAYTPQYRLTKLVKDIRDKDAPADLSGKKFRYRPKEPKPRDWFRYTDAQVNEMGDFLVLVRNMVDATMSKLDYITDSKVCGRRHKSPFDLAKALLLQQYFEASNRVAAGLVNNVFKEKLGITDDLTYKDIERAYGHKDVIDVLDTIVLMTNEPIRDKETEFSIDGTGMPTSMKQNYETDKGAKQAAGYDMLVGMIGVEYMMFSAYGIGDHGEESPWLVPLLDQTSHMFSRIDMVAADAAYLSRHNCDFIEAVGAVPRILPKSNTSIKADGSHAWQRMLFGFINETQSWMLDYHKRSCSESVNNSLKTSMPRPLLKRRDDRRFGEISARVTAYNIRILGYVHYTKDVSVPWLTG